MSRCGNCGKDNRNGSGICNRCEEQWREEQERIRACAEQGPVGDPSLDDDLGGEP